MKILYTNIRSIRRNFEELEVIAANSQYQIIVLTECWIRNQEENIPRLDNYSIVFVSSNYGKSGGIVIYVKSFLNYEQINIKKILDHDISDEFLYINIKNIKLNVIAIYRHPSTDIKLFFKNLEKLFISKYLNNGNKTILLGDININIMNTTKETEEYKNILKYFDYIILNKEYTFIRKNYRSILDHIMIKSRNLDYFHYQISEHNITDHEIIEISYKIDATDFDVKNSRRLYTKKHKQIY
ncbi:MAG TPA: hypothetical protein DDZ39_03415 [Flavobacteriaceae bacterium]|nr:hypothetical protein [Flavobacteriaceae bacterium]